MSRDITQLHPKLQTIIPQIIQRCSALGLPVLVTDGFRTKAEQDKIYAQGRTAPGSIVTQVQWPNSAHNWGVAFDFCRNVRGREYDDGDNFFRRVAEVAKTYGLEWGGDWTRFVDKPHLQLKEFMPGNSTAWLRQTYGSPEKFRQTWAPKNDPEKEEAMKDLNDDIFSIAKTGDRPTSWHREACAWAKEQGIFKGDGSGNYGWQKAVTREQLAQILYNLYGGRDVGTN